MQVHGILADRVFGTHSRTGANLIVQRRRMGKPPEVVAIAVKAQHRLYKKFWRLSMKKHLNVAVSAVARELCGFVWAIMNAVPQPR